MRITPIHHEPMKPEFKSPFSAAYAVEDAKLIFFSGCCTIPIYHKHPHDPEEERRWLAGNLREQTERTFQHIKLILDAANADFSNVLFLTIYMTEISGQDILNDISARYFDPASPPGRTLVQVVALAHPDMLIEIDGVAAVEKGA
jgi:2-iminobutanoate/2-iminopropanoate deaminase